jgi:FKBP-type peptidyl-prolyl cis-trans isomerase 2
MKHLLLLLSLALVMTACTKDTTPAPTTTLSPEQNTSTETPKSTTMKVNYTLRLDSADGKVFDTNIESVAKESGLHESGSTYAPLPVTLGAGGVVPGFEENIKTMKKGEKKSFAVAPKDGYGESRITTVVEKRELEPEFSATVDKSQFQDRITETIQRNLLGVAGSGLTVGQTLTGGMNQDIIAKVMKIDGDNITLDIDNSKLNIFSGKELKVGATAEKNGASFVITAMSDTGVTIDVKNTKSPFYGKAFEPGAT